MENKSKKKQTEKILGVTYTVGTKAHAIAAQILKLIRQNQD